MSIFPGAYVLFLKIIIIIGCIQLSPTQNRLTEIKERNLAISINISGSPLSGISIEYRPFNLLLLEHMAKTDGEARENKVERETHYREAFNYLRDCLSQISSKLKGQVEEDYLG